MLKRLSKIVADDILFNNFSEKIILFIISKTIKQIKLSSAAFVISTSRNEIKQ